MASLALYLTYGVQTDCKAQVSVPQINTVNKAVLISEHVPFMDSLVKAWQVIDKKGKHILILDRRAGASPSRPDSGRIEHIDLTAAYYGQDAAAWKVEWTIRDGVDCPGLDAAAEFITSSVSVTDLDKDGIAEITVPYKLFCGGGIDSSTIKIILRQGAFKLAIRGTSLVELPGQAAFGGEHRYDSELLLPSRRPYKKHMDKIWHQVSENGRD